MKPHVREMDQAGAMKKEIVDSLFANGLMGMEIPVDHGGSGMNFTSACVAVEEVAGKGWRKCWSGGLERRAGAKRKQMQHGG